MLPRQECCQRDNAELNSDRRESVLNDLLCPSRPILRYHGGKWILAPWIISHFPPHRVYVEPFGGAASVLLRKPRSYAEVYNDLDREIVSLFRVARERGEELRRALELTPFARQEYLEAWHPSDDPLEQARRTVIRAYMGFASAAVTLGRVREKHISRRIGENGLSRQQQQRRHDTGARLEKLSGRAPGNNRKVARRSDRKQRC